MLIRVSPWMMPVCIDLSIAGATLALLSLSRSTAAVDAASEAGQPAAALAPVSDTRQREHRHHAAAAAPKHEHNEASPGGMGEVERRPKAVPGPRHGHGLPDGARLERPALVAVSQPSQPGPPA
jgi:hypothetical protein